MAHDPTLAMLFNDKKGPELALEAIRRDHAFVESEVVETEDEQGRRAYLLVIACETAPAEQLFALGASRMPDYIRARHYPLSRVVRLRGQAARRHLAEYLDEAQSG
jgi:hypothetical protein